MTDNIRLGVLALYKKYFYETGRKLLDHAHTITYDEYIEFTKDHETYNGLGGNHEGDQIYKAVMDKYSATVKPAESA